MPKLNAKRGKNENERGNDRGYELVMTACMILVGFVLATYGWGRIVVWAIYRGRLGSISFSCALGLSTWNFLGGLLNVMGWAYPATLDLIVYLGLVTTGFLIGYAFHRGHSRLVTWCKNAFNTDCIPLILVFLSTAFLLWALVPTYIFNFHDDFHTYIPRTIRMLNTGTLGGNPFAYLGFDGLGAQSFFQAFILSRYPIEYLNGFDPVFCYLVSGWLINDIGRKANVHWLYRTVCLLMFAFINPQYVNSSSLYSGTLMILGLVYATLILLTCETNSKARAMFMMSIPVGLFSSTLLALKSTYIPFVVSFVTLLFFFGLLTKHTAPQGRESHLGDGEIKHHNTFILIDCFAALA